MMHKKKRKPQAVAGTGKAGDPDMILETRVGADTMIDWWVHGDGEPQRVLWPMRPGQTRQGNMTLGMGMVAFSPRADH